MIHPLGNLFRRKVTEDFSLKDEELERLGAQLKERIASVFGRSLNIRELDSGSDNATEIELVNLSNPFYDIERFGVPFVASPRHADVLIVTGAVTHNMEIAARKTWDAMPSPKFVVAVGDDACDGGIFKGTYAVNGGADTVLPGALKIPGNPPSPRTIMLGLLRLMEEIRNGTVSSTPG